MSQEILKKWIMFAKADLDAASRLLKSPKPTSWTFLLAAWHCHQTIEKMLKMVMIKKGKELLKIHDVVRLASLARVELSQENENFLKDLNEFYLRPRYPDTPHPAYPKVSKKQAGDIFIMTNKMFLWLKKQ